MTYDWIDAKVEKPKNMGPVLTVYMGRVQWTMWRWCQDHWECAADGYPDAGADVFSHWAPRPKSPTEERDTEPTDEMSPTLGRDHAYKLPTGETMVVRGGSLEDFKRACRVPVEDEKKPR
jgi:hypothetical protein